MPADAPDRPRSRSTRDARASRRADLAAYSPASASRPEPYSSGGTTPAAAVPPPAATRQDSPPMDPRDTRHRSGPPRPDRERTVSPARQRKRAAAARPEIRNLAELGSRAAPRKLHRAPTTSRGITP